MKESWEVFYELLTRKDKQGAYNYCLQLLENKEINVIELYEQILTPALNKSTNAKGILEEHIQTGIVRTIVENCFFYVNELQQTKRILSGKTAIVFCPQEEYHDLGAKIAADFLTILGYDTIFIGANLPIGESLQYIRENTPDLVAVSVSNYYHLVSVSELVLSIKSISDKKIKVILGGSAFFHNPNFAKDAGADGQVTTFSDMKYICSEGVE